MSPFDDFDRRFRQAAQFHRVAFGMVIALWVAVVGLIITAGVFAVREGPDGIAAEAGRAVAAFENAREAAKAEGATP